MTEHVRMFVDGDWVDAEGGAVFEAIGPSTGAVVGTVAEGTRGDAQRAIDAANRAWPAWAALSVFDRAAAMERVAEVIDERRDDLARTLTLDQGKPLRAEAHDEVEELIAYFEMAAADARRMEGLMPPSVDANKRVLAVPRPARRGRRSSARGTGRTRCPPRSWRRRSRTGTPSCGHPRPPRRSARRSSRSASRRPRSRPAS